MNHDSSHQNVKQPWFRYPLVWLVILLPTSSVAAGIAIVIIAVNNADAPVVDQWYKQGRAVNYRRDQEQRAAHLGLSFRFLESGRGTTVASLQAGHPIPEPETVTALLQHPLLPQKDRTITYTHVGDGQYQASATLPSAGEYEVTLSSPNGKWRLRDRVQFDHMPLSIGEGAMR